jgi:hypothetical protein
MSDHAMHSYFHVDIDLDISKALAFCCGKHCRLGMQAAFREFPDDLVEMIVGSLFLSYSYNKKLAHDTLPLIFSVQASLLLLCCLLDHLCAGCFVAFVLPCCLCLALLALSCLVAFVLLCWLCLALLALSYFVAFVLLSHSHFSMQDFAIPPSINMNDVAAEVGRILSLQTMRANYFFTGPDATLSMDSLDSYMPIQEAVTKLRRTHHEHIQRYSSRLTAVLQLEDGTAKPPKSPSLHRFAFPIALSGFANLLT